MAEAVFRSLAARESLPVRIVASSAGIRPTEVGGPPSELAVRCAARRGYDLRGHQVRALQLADLSRFDQVLGLDRGHVAYLRDLAPANGRIETLLHYAPNLDLEDVPDPWQGAMADYDRALDLIEAGCRGYLADLRRRHVSG
jgi:protein-tyrosine phosphatase